MIGEFLTLVSVTLAVVDPVLIKVAFNSALFPSNSGPDSGLLYRIFGWAALTIATGGHGIIKNYQADNMGISMMRDLPDTL